MAIAGDQQFKYCYYNWYFGCLDRREANHILERESIGVFLVRDSSSKPGDFVLCVCEPKLKESDGKIIKNYIIGTIVGTEATSFKIGDQIFPDLPSLIECYKIHYLGSTCLIKPARRIRVLTKHNFPGQEPEDLPFKVGEYLEVISKCEREWWIAENSKGEIGRIPVNFVELNCIPITETPKKQSVNNRHSMENHRQSTEANGQTKENHRQSTEANGHTMQNDRKKSEPQINPLFKDIKLPAKAIAILARNPNMYTNHLKLKVDDIVIVTKMNPTGQWEGEVNGKSGIFPYNYIRFLEPEELQKL